MLQRIEFVSFSKVLVSLVGRVGHESYHQVGHTSEREFWKNEQVQSLKIVRIGFGEDRILDEILVAVLPYDKTPKFDPLRG